MPKEEEGTPKPAVKPRKSEKVGVLNYREFFSALQYLK